MTSSRDLLPASPLDIIGDVHGEVDALRNLLGHLGYTEDGRHTQDRTLVYVGDLVDRGPDSPAVVRMVMAQVKSGRALALLGNHELNLLRQQRKEGNDWYWNEGTHRDQRFAPFETASASERASFLEFFAHMPLTASRADLRVVHAAWHAPSVAVIEAAAGASAEELFDRAEEDADRVLHEGPLADRIQAERAQWKHHFNDPAVDMPMLDAIGERDEFRQMNNPVRILTSGLERRTRRPFYSKGQWRFAERVRWWNEYTEVVPVVVGHYWREYSRTPEQERPTDMPDVFEGTQAFEWLGPHRNVFCIDYSVGGRYKERALGQAGKHTRLAALRWPERELAFEDGQCISTNAGS